jgi:hypothetical protein
MGIHASALDSHKSLEFREINYLIQFTPLMYITRSPSSHADIINKNKIKLFSVCMPFGLLAPKT